MDLLYFEFDAVVRSLPSSSVVEVLPIGFLTPVPTAPPAVRGVIQTHGQVVPVIDLSLSPTRPIRPGAPLVIVEVGDQRFRVALLVEYLHDAPPVGSLGERREVVPLDFSSAILDLRRRIERR